MHNESAVTRSKTHVPRLVLSHHTHKVVHGDHPIGRFNTRIAVAITRTVGSMWCAYAFAVLALVSLPAAIRSNDPIIIVAWIAQTFLQLVLLPIIIVGQNIQGKAADKRSEETYNDAEAVLHECLQIQDHLSAQDKAQQEQIEELKQLLAQLRGTPPASAPA